MESIYILLYFGLDWWPVLAISMWQNYFSETLHASDCSFGILLPLFKQAYVTLLDDEKHIA